LKKALILTYYWPPGSGPGVQRWLKFCKYLPEHDWQPIVITVKNGSYPSIDESLLKEVPEDLQVIRTRAFEPFALYNALRGKSGKSIEVGMGNIKGNSSWFGRLSNYVRANFFVPDARIGWNIATVPEALRLIKVEQPDVIITTGPPHSTHLMGLRLKVSSGLPWLVDLRDPWTTIYYNAILNRSKKTIAQDQALENAVIREADALLVASPGLRNEFSGRAHDITFIPNGYDEQDFLHLPIPSTESFTLAYVGNLKSVQNMPGLWKAMQELAEEVPGFNASFRLSITGNIADQIQQAITAAGIERMVELKPFVPHREAIEAMHHAHVLLLPVPNEQGNQSILTGKIFEYLATRRPILSIGPKDGNAAQILAECEKDPMLDYHDKAGIKQQLLHYFEEYQSHASPMVTGNQGYLNYSRKGNTEKLVAVLNRLLR
jgi:glycosyltransferase involved in cell wall biosynthesis